MNDLVDNPGREPTEGHYVPPVPDRKPGRRRRWVNGIAFVVIVGLGGGAMAGLIATREQVAPVERQETVYSVATLPVAYADHRPVLTVYGEIAAGKQTDLRALVAGDIVQASDNFRNGGAVKRGEALIVIDPFDYEAQVAESRARIAESNARIRSETLSLTHDREVWTLREQDAKRFERLRAKGSVSQKVRDQAIMELTLQTQTVARREAAIETEKAKLTQLQVALDRAERDLTRTVLRAPFDGFLSQVSVQVGAVVSGNDRLAHLVGSGAFEAQGHLSDAQYGRLLADGGLEGRPATVHWTVGERRITYDAVIARLTAAIQANTGGVTFYALLDADGIDLPIRPGAFVEIALPDQHFPDAVRLPGPAIHDDSRVFVLGDDGRLAERAISVLGREGDDVIVTGDLKPGERVVLTRFAEMAPGVRAQDPALTGDTPVASAQPAADG